MAEDFFIEPATILLPEIAPLRAFKWQHLPINIAQAVAQEEQYLIFHFTLLERLRFTQAACVNQPPWSRPIGLMHFYTHSKKTHFSYIIQASKAYNPSLHMLALAN